MEKCGALQMDSNAMKANLEKIKKCEALQKEIDEMKITIASLEDKIRHDKLQDMKNGGNKRRSFRLRLRRNRTVKNGNT